jgi:hypothetical protein
MIFKEVEQVDPDGEPTGDRTQGIVLEPEELKAILNSIKDLSYNPRTDIFECAGLVVQMADELDS